MEVEEEDSGSSQDNFCFLDNSTNPETIRQDPAPSTSRITVPMSSRNFRINKVWRKSRSNFKPSPRSLRRDARRDAAPAAGPSTSSGTTPLPEEDRCKNSSSHSSDREEFPRNVRLSVVHTAWPSRDMATIFEESAAAVVTRRSGFKTLPRKLRKLARAERDVAGGPGGSGSGQNPGAALRTALENMKAMSVDHPEALKGSLPDDAIDLLKRLHI